MIASFMGPLQNVRNCQKKGRVSYLLDDYTIFSEIIFCNYLHEAQILSSTIGETLTTHAFPKCLSQQSSNHVLSKSTIIYQKSLAIAHDSVNNCTFGLAISSSKKNEQFHTLPEVLPI